MVGVRIAVVGATGMIGRELIHLLFEKGLNESHLRLYASWQSVGSSVPYGNSYLTVLPLSSMVAEDHDLIFWAAGASLSREFLSPFLHHSHVTIIDCSDAWRSHKNVPLVVPEVNALSLKNHHGVVSSPNCSSTILSIVLYPLHKVFHALQLVVSTYQASSGSGLSGMDELLLGMGDYVSGRSVRHHVFDQPLLLNLIPCIGSLTENGSSEEELKMTTELRKIFDEPHFLVSCTAVRVPTLRVHAFSVSACFDKEISVHEAEEIWKHAPGLSVCSPDQYPTPLTTSQKKDVFVGRLRQSAVFLKKGLDFFVAGDQILKGGALNAVQIAEEMGII